MGYEEGSCECSNEFLMKNVSQCKSCGTEACDGCLDEITQKRIWKQVKAPASLYTMNLAALTISNNRFTNPQLTTNNQSSDRQVPSVGTYYVPSHGNTMRSTVTRHRPGASGPGGIGVDVKHNSYARYLARKKGQNLRTETQEVTPAMGNKTKMYGMISGCSCNQ